MISEVGAPEARSYVRVLAEALRDERKKQSYSQEGFASHLGIDRARYGRIERGQLDMRFATLMEILEALNVQPEEFFRTIRLAKSPPRARQSKRAIDVREPFRVPEEATTYCQVLGALVKHERKQTGMNQEEFALEHGFARSWFSGLESGRRNPSLAMVMRLVEALHQEPSQFFAHIRIPA